MCTCARVVVVTLTCPAVHLPALSLLRGAEQMGMHKAVKPQFGGGMRRFSCEEDNIYENVESELCFFTSQVNPGCQCGHTSSEEVAPMARCAFFVSRSGRALLSTGWTI